jgi:hypothetical protein
VSNFKNERHNLYCGWVMGQAVKFGIVAEPVIDDDGNYTDRVRLPEIDGVAIELVIPEPPAEWSL